MKDKTRRLLFYALISVAILKIGIHVLTRFVLDDTMEAYGRYEVIKREIENFKHFDDSLVANEGFRKRIIDTVSSPAELMLVKQNVAKGLAESLNRFHEQNPHLDIMVRTLELFDPLKQLLNGLMICFALPLLIPFVGRLINRQ